LVGRKGTSSLSLYGLGTLWNLPYPEGGEPEKNLFLGMTRMETASSLGSGNSYALFLMFYRNGEISYI
jgi:hypothetical protein